jgi:hypothetical protein
MEKGRFAGGSVAGFHQRWWFSARGLAVAGGCLVCWRGAVLRKIRENREASENYPVFSGLPRLATGAP